MIKLKEYLCIEALFPYTKEIPGYLIKGAKYRAPQAEMELVYLKSEADKVIADLEESHKKEVEQLLMEIVELKKKLDIYKRGFKEDDETIAYLYAELRHINYKRCLAMAEWCDAIALWCYQAANTLPAGFRATLHGKHVMIEPNRLFKRSALLTKWSVRWRALTEKFKEAK